MNQVDDAYRHAPRKMYAGLSAQYGRKAKKPDMSGGDEVWFNFTVYENGEVQIKTGRDSTVMSRDAFLSLLHLFTQATKSTIMVDPAMGAFIPVASSNADLLKGILNDLILKDARLNFFHLQRTDLPQEFLTIPSAHPATWNIAGEPGAEGEVRVC
jgi:hypothetical protein